MIERVCKGAERVLTQNQSIVVYQLGIHPWAVVTGSSKKFDLFVYSFHFFCSNFSLANFSSICLKNCAVKSFNCPLELVVASSSTGTSVFAFKNNGAFWQRKTWIAYWMAAHRFVNICWIWIKSIENNVFNGRFRMLLQATNGFLYKKNQEKSLPSLLATFWLFEVLLYKRLLSDTERYQYWYSRKRWIQYQHVRQWHLNKN